MSPIENENNEVEEDEEEEDEEVYAVYYRKILNVDGMYYMTYGGGNSGGYLRDDNGVWHQVDNTLNGWTMIPTTPKTFIQGDEMEGRVDRIR